MWAFAGSVEFEDVEGLIVSIYVASHDLLFFYRSGSRLSACHSSISPRPEVFACCLMWES